MSDRHGGEPESLGTELATIVKEVTGRTPVPNEYFCDQCHFLVKDAGEEMEEWFKSNRPELFPLEGPTMCRCVDAADLEARRVQRKIDNMNLPKRELTGPLTFDNFDATLPGTGEMFEIVKAWADGTLPESFLTVIGITGSGKSHLLEAAVAHMDALGMSVRYERAEVMLNMLRHTFRDVEEDYGQDIQDVMDWYDGFDALIIDDIGANRVTEWGVGYMYLMLDKRYADGRKVAIGTNIIDDAEMEKAWGARITSRCFDKNSGIVRVLWSEANDYRKA